MNNQYKDVLTELYESLNKMDLNNEHFDVVVHAIQEIQHLRALTESYQRCIREDIKQYMFPK